MEDREVSDADGFTLTEHEITDQREGHRQSRKADVHLRIGDDLTIESGEWSFLYRRIDRVGRMYHEWIVDPVTGEPIHHDHGPLENHTGHGSAKPPGP